VAATECGPDRQSHIAALDGLRGVAILLVVLHHFAMFGGFEPATKLDAVAVALTGAGWAGVDLFFVLSGFLITRILLNSNGERHFFRNFYARRILRIFPLYYAMLGLFFVVGPVVAWASGWIPRSVEEPYRDIVNDQAWYWSYLVNFRIAFHGWPEFGALAHFWTLAIEEQFYLAWPLFVFYLGGRNLLRLCVFLIVASLAIRLQLMWQGEILGAYVLTPARLDALALGGVLAVIANKAGGLQPWRRLAGLVGGMSAIALGAIAIWRRGLWSGDTVTGTVGLTLLACFFGTLVVLSVTAPRRDLLSRLLRSEALMTLGRYSYGLYVFHHPIALVMGRVVQIHDLPLVLGSRLPTFVLYTLLGGGLSLAVSALSWHSIEKYFRRLKYKFQPIAAEAAR
jgi:peptidoglycan/LPS O-acetylase OafA/YrhL